MNEWPLSVASDDSNTGLQPKAVTPCAWPDVHRQAVNIGADGCGWGTPAFDYGATVL